MKNFPVCEGLPYGDRGAHETISTETVTRGGGTAELCPECAQIVRQRFAKPVEEKNGSKPTVFVPKQ